MCDCKMEMTKQEMLDTTENFIGMEFMNVKMVLSDLQTLSGLERLSEYE